MSRQIGPNLWKVGVRTWRKAPTVVRAVGDSAWILIPLGILSGIIGFFFWLIPFMNGVDAEIARNNHPVHVEKCEAKGGKVEVYSDDEAECLIGSKPIDVWWTGGAK